MPILLACLLLLAPVPGAVSGPVRPSTADALAVLHGWDQRRAAAWAAGDEGRVRGLYVRGSRAGAADLHLLRAYAARGLVVRRIDVQVFSVVVLDAATDRLRVRVLDRVAGGEVVHGDRVEPLGTTTPTVEVIELRRDAATWQVVAVTAPRGARSHPLSETAPAPRGRRP